MYAVERTSMHIARIEMCYTKDPELRALRSLMREKPAYSFKNLRRVLEGDESKVYPTFVEAADASGLWTGSEDAARACHGRDDKSMCRGLEKNPTRKDGRVRWPTSHVTVHVYHACNVRVPS